MFYHIQPDRCANDNTQEVVRTAWDVREIFIIIAYKTIALFISDYINDVDSKLAFCKIQYFTGTSNLFHDAINQNTNGRTELLPGFEIVHSKKRLHERRSRGQNVFSLC